MDFCACMGPMYGDPHCYCVMKSLGLEPSAKYEWTAADEARLNEALSKVFNWRDKNAGV